LTFKEYLSSLRGKSVAVVGAGISNSPLIDALLTEGIDVTICDKQSGDEIARTVNSYKERGAELRLGSGYLEDIDANVIFRTPGLMPSHPALIAAAERGSVLTSEMEVFFEVCPCRIIAVTGSDGKTTTTSLIAELLKNEGLTVYKGGNIGNPLLCEADDMQKDGIAVLELSSFQLITMKKSPDIAVITNIAPNHLDTHNNMQEYIDAKRNIYIHQKCSDKAVFNMDNDITRAFADSAPGDKLYFSRCKKVSDGVYLDGGVIYGSTCGHSEKIMPISDVLLPGMHNIENVMAAFAAVRGLVRSCVMMKTAQTFRSVRHRIELVRELRGVSYYNDSIATSPSRAIAGLRAFDQKVILIAGGKDKGIAFDEFGSEIVSHVKTLVLTGATAGMIRDSVMSSPGYSGVPEILSRDSFSDAVLAAAGSAQNGDIILLSPACTSFDSFKNFEERGDKFREIVMGLG